MMNVLVITQKCIKTAFLLYCRSIYTPRKFILIEFEFFTPNALKLHFYHLPKNWK